MAHSCNARNFGFEQFHGNDNFFNEFVYNMYERKNISKFIHSGLILVSLIISSKKFVNRTYQF